MERRKRRWWTRGITWLSLIAISGALLSGLFQLAVVLAPGYRDDIATRASAALGQPVRVDALSLRWRWLWPLLELRGVRLLAAPEAAPVMAVERIRLGYSLAQLVRGEWTPSQVEIAGVTLAAEITAEGQWRLAGRLQNRPAPSFAEVAEQLKRYSRLRAERVTLQVHDLRKAGVDFTARLQRGDLRLDDQGFELRADLEAPELLASRLRLRAGMAGDLAAPASWQGRWTLDASNVHAGAALLRYLPALARVQWTDVAVTAAGDWQQGAPGATDLSLRAQALALQDQADSGLRVLDLGLHYRPTAEGGTVDVVPLRLSGRKGAWPVTTARLEWRRGADRALEWRINSDFLRLDDLAPWAAALLPGRTPAETAVLQSLKGDVSALDGRWQPTAAGNDRYSLHLRLADFAARWQGAGAFKAAVQGLRGELSADENGGRAQLRGEPLMLELPTLFEQPQRAKRLGADVQWQRAGQGWRVRVPRLDWALLGSEGQASGELRLPADASPQLKLQARFNVADVAALKPLMPQHWGQPLKDWLQRAVVRGRVANALLDIDGPLADFPFHKNPTGQWSLKLPVAGARLEYHRDWPGVDQLATTVRFTGNGLAFEAQRGVINGVAVTSAKGGIDDFAKSALVIDGKTAGEAPFYYAFLRASPLLARLQTLLNHSQAEGPVQTDVHLEIPLHSDLEQKTIARGEVRLLGNNLRYEGLDQPVREITGKLRFGGSVGIAAEDLHGRFYELPVSARIAPNAEGNDALSAAFKVDYQLADGIAARYVPSWLRPQLRGASDWLLAIPLGGSGSGHVRLSSTLIGASSLLPPPFAKSAEQAMPLSLDLSGDEQVPLTLIGEIPGRLGLALRFARGSSTVPELRGLNLRIGDGAAPQVPKSDGWLLSGALDVFEPAAWRPLLAAIQDGNGSSRGGTETLPFLGAALSAQALRVAGYDIPAVQIEAKREYGGISASLRGEGTAGTLKLSTAGDALSGQFARLRLNAAPKAAVAAAALAGNEEPSDPTRAPTLDIAVAALSIGGRDFGSLALASERTPSGQRLRRFALEGGIARITAEGDWRRVRGLTEAESHFIVTSDDLAGTLDGLGFAPTVSGRNARIEGRLIWPAAARGFDWAQGRGAVSLMVEDGALSTVDPGSTSRVLGLFNFYALPRRLTLDFGDVVSKGLGFDRIEGQFQLGNGVAHTDDLTVRGPSVRIEVRGDIGLAARDYNEVVTVTPNTKGITLGALILGGASAVAVPILPVIAVIANQVLDKPLGQVTQLTYRLTGSWDNPEIRKLDQTPTTKPETAPP